MPKFQNPGNFFLGTLVPSEQKFLKTLIENALKSGYTKFIEPCAGAFAMSHLAVQAGFKPNQIEASDVSMFTSIMGYAITSQSLKELCLHAKGFDDEELLDPAVALYAWKYLSLIKNAGKDYFYNYLVDMEQRREIHIKAIREQLDRAKKILGGMSYRALDMWKHIDEVLDDPHALIIANPPTYLAGFEKYYDTCCNMTWKEPEYGLFDPDNGLQELMDKVKNAKCLVVCYEENSPGKTAGAPIFSRYGVRAGINVYLTKEAMDAALKAGEIDEYVITGGSVDDSKGYGRLKALTDAIKKLNRKTKETVTLSLYNFPHLIDFNDRIVLDGAEYYLVGNTARTTPRLFNEQNLTLVRWF